MKRTELLAEYGPVDLALLGEYFDRKNRGRGFILTRLDQAAPVVDSVGVDSLAGQITITCGVQPSEPVPPPGGLEEPAPAGTVYAPPVKGLLFWGNDGVETFAEFDYLAGTVLSISAASVRVLAMLDEGANPELPTFVPPLVVAHIGYMPRGGQNAQRTRSVALDAAGGNNRARIAIPPYARQLEVLQTTSLIPAGASFDLSFLTAEPPAVVLAGESTAAPFVQRPIPQGARVVEIQNNADNAAVFQLIFRLWL